jgi:hypothetical protein
MRRKIPFRRARTREPRPKDFGLTDPCGIPRLRPVPTAVLDSAGSRLEGRRHKRLPEFQAARVV